MPKSIIKKLFSLVLCILGYHGLCCKRILLEKGIEKKPGDVYLLHGAMFLGFGERKYFMPFYFEYVDIQTYQRKELCRVD